MAYATGSVVVRGTPLTLKSSGAETASTDGASVATGPDGGSLYVTMDITASSGTPTILLAVQGSVDGSTWVTLGQIGANGYVAGTPATAPTTTVSVSTRRAVLPSMPFVRYSSTIGGGTPSVTYSVTAVAL